MGLGRCVACILCGGLAILWIIGISLPESTVNAVNAGYAVQRDIHPSIVRDASGRLTCAFVNNHRLGDWAELDRHKISTRELVGRVIECTR